MTVPMNRPVHLPPQLTMLQPSTPSTTSHTTSRPPAPSPFDPFSTREWMHCS
jgi:hypothetical protein